MAWNKKKMFARFVQYLDSKQIPYEIDEENAVVKMDLFFKERGYMLYPYVRIEAGICSVDINVSKNSLKSFNYEKLNQFNIKSKFFKGFLTEEGILTLEYRFLLDEIDSTVFDSLWDSLYQIEMDIDSL